MKQLEEQNKVCSAMYDSEKYEQADFDADLKQEIAEAASVQLSDVEDVLQKYKQLKDFHGWLKERKANDMPMPESRDELMHIYRMERPAFLFKKEDRKRSHSRKQMSYFNRRHRT